MLSYRLVRHIQSEYSFHFIKCYSLVSFQLVIVWNTRTVHLIKATVNINIIHVVLKVAVTHLFYNL